MRTVVAEGAVEAVVAMVEVMGEEVVVMAGEREVTAVMAVMAAAVVVAMVVATVAMEGEAAANRPLRSCPHLHLRQMRRRARYA